MSFRIAATRRTKHDLLEAIDEQTPITCPDTLIHLVKQAIGEMTDLSADEEIAVRLGGHHDGIGLVSLELHIFTRPA